MDAELRGAAKWEEGLPVVAAAAVLVVGVESATVGVTNTVVHRRRRHWACY